MNLVERCRRVKIIKKSEDKYIHKPVFEENKVYEIAKIKKCSGKFKCAETCTTKCFSVSAYVPINGEIKEVHTCDYIIQTHFDIESLFAQQERNK